jgi:hypothetical protein
LVVLPGASLLVWACGASEGIEELHFTRSANLTPAEALK